jgi:membrane-bound serine protease (ClpP class)
MSGELLQVIALLTLGYLLMLMELFVPGGILGILGIGSVVYGCWLAFSLGPAWGAASILLSLAAAVIAVVLVVRSRTARKLVLDSSPSRNWKAPDRDLETLVGETGMTISPLRPAGIADVGDRRLDVVTDSEFLDAGVPIRIREVEGPRVVVEPVRVEKTPQGAD